MAAAADMFNIDVSHEYDADEIRSSFAVHGLTVTDFIEVGPGGGNPNYTVSGTDKAFRAWLHGMMNETDIELYRC